MKKSIIIFALAAAAVCSASCDKPNNGKEKGDAKLNIAASGFTFADTDSVAVFEYTADWSDKLISKPAVITDGKASFTVTLPKMETESPVSYISVYPAADASIFMGQPVVSLPSRQKYTAKAADPAADLLLASTETLEKRVKDVDMRYARVGSTIRLSLEGVPTEEIIQSITLASESCVLSGDKAVNPDGTLGEVLNPVKSVVATPETSASKAAVAWFRTFSGQLNDYNITVVTDKGKYIQYNNTPVVLEEGKSSMLTFKASPLAKKDVIRIFLIGNSFTQDACHRLPGVLVGLGINNVEVTQCYYGGRLVSEYNNGWETSSDYTKHTALPGESVMTNTSGANLKKVAESQEWDIVCIQEHTGNAAAWSWNSTEKGHIQGLMDKVAATQKKRPLFYYILSQTYYDENKIGSGSRPSITWTDQAGMYDVTTAFAKKVMEEIPFDGIIATGTALQNLRQTSLNNAMCLTRDGYHMDYGISRYTAACTCYQVMLYPVLGIELETCKFRITESNYTSGNYTTPVTDENVGTAFAAAKAAARNPYQVTYLNEKAGSNGSAGSALGTVDHGDF